MSSSSLRKDKTRRDYSYKKEDLFRIKREPELPGGYDDQDNITDGPPTPPDSTASTDDLCTFEREQDVDGKGASGSRASFKNALPNRKRIKRAQSHSPTHSSNSSSSSKKYKKRKKRKSKKEKKRQKKEKKRLKKTSEEDEQTVDEQSASHAPGGGSISDLNGFTASIKVKLVTPNSFTADIQQPSPVMAAQPQNAPYKPHQPDDEVHYVNKEENSINAALLHHDQTNSDSSRSDNEWENEKMQKKEVEHLTNYFYERSKVYSKYNFAKRNVEPEGFPVCNIKQEILHAIENNQVVIIEGFKGSGMTTQVPQYILDECHQRKSFCNIVVTQPTKIAATSAVKQICYERNWDVGSVVGYQVGMDDDEKWSKTDTLLTFMTTDVLLRKLIIKNSLKGFTHLIIDEVEAQDRNLKSDFLLSEIKRIMSAHRLKKDSHVKVILLSATIEVHGKTFQEYFRVVSRNGETREPPVVKIPFETSYDLLNKEKDLLNNNIASKSEKDKTMIQEPIITKGMEAEHDGELVRRYHTGPDNKISRVNDTVYKLRKTRGKCESDFDIFCPGDFLSRVHCEISRKLNAYWIKDLNSTNGTFLNGVQIKEYAKRELRFGDTIGLGVSHLTTDPKQIKEDPNYFIFDFIKARAKADLPLPVVETPQIPGPAAAADHSFSSSSTRRPGSPSLLDTDITFETVVQYFMASSPSVTETSKEEKVELIQLDSNESEEEIENDNDEGSKMSFSSGGEVNHANRESRGILKKKRSKC